MEVQLETIMLRFQMHYKFHAKLVKISFKLEQNLADGDDGEG